jgi:hypothetical protein
LLLNPFKAVLLCDKIFFHATTNLPTVYILWDFVLVGKLPHRAHASVIATRENQPALLCDVGAVEATNLFPRIFLPIIAK